MHKVDQFIVNPPHKLTVILVGVGGNGIRMLTQLARIDTILNHLGHPGFHVIAFDPKPVTEACRSRQLFGAGDVGQNKAVIAVNRINRMMSLGWEARPDKWRSETGNLIITCVDSYEARKKASVLKETIYNSINGEQRQPHYWLDLGNGDYHGQFVIGSLNNKKLKCVDDIFPEILEKTEDEPSCSMIESIAKQSPFINHILTDLAALMLYRMITELEIDYQGMIINIKDNIYNKIMI